MPTGHDETVATGRVFTDQGWSLYDFGADVLVHCPTCDAPARVFLPDQAGGATSPRERHTWRLSCLACGLVRERRPRSTQWGGNAEVGDPVFRLPLWLQAPCCGRNVLWAYNLEHLTIIEGFVAAKIRQKYHPVGAERRGMIHKLPTWLKSAKNRDEILSTIARLRASLDRPDRRPVGAGPRRRKGVTAPVSSGRRTIL